MEIRQLRTFKKVVELKSFSKAAEILNYGQSTVSEHIQALEREVGAPLFDRLGRMIQVTSVGEELYGYTLELLEAYGKIKQISVNQEGLTGHLTVGVSESILIYKLQSFLSAFRSDHPHVNIALISDNCQELRTGLRSGKLDLTITMEPAYMDKDLVVDQLNAEPLVFIGRKTEKMDDLRLEDLGKTSVIFTEKACVMRRCFENYLFNQDIQPQGSMTFSSIEAIKQCVVSGLGISLLPRMSVDDLINSDKVQVIPNNDGEMAFYIQMSHHKNKWVSPLLGGFMQAVRDSLT